MPRLRLMTVNAAAGLSANRRWGDRGHAGRGRLRFVRRVLAHIAALARAHRVDVVAVQELDILSSPAATLDSADELAALLEMSGHFVPLVDVRGPGGGCLSGLATFSALPVVDVRTIPLPRPPPFTRAGRLLTGLCRRAQLVDVVPPGLGGPLRVLHAHLSHRPTRCRERELELLARLACGGLPTVIAGDLNTALPASRTADMCEAPLYRRDNCFDIVRDIDNLIADPRLVSALAGGPADPALATYPSARPSLKLDYVLAVSPHRRLSLTERVVPLGTGVSCERGPHRAAPLSDHRAVVAELSY